MVVIIDYGMGNLKSVTNALDKLNIESKLSTSLNDIKHAEALILPGVGAFKDAMDNLEKCNYVDIIKEKVDSGCPILGICLGMQMMFEKGYEIDERKGLGFFKGAVELMNPIEKVKIPHIGWNNLIKNNKNKILDDLDDSYVYFVHSYAASKIDNKELVAYVNYGGSKIPALMAKGNVFGTQFHPEKSGQVGLKILENFWRMIK